MASTANIQRIFNDLTFTSEFKFSHSIVIKKNTYEILTTDTETIIKIDDDYEYNFYNDTERIEVFKNRIDVYTKRNTYFYKNNLIRNTKIYKPTQGFILNKHVIKTSPHPRFELNKTIIVPFRTTSQSQVWFIFDIEDKRETYANALNSLSIPIEIVDNIAFKLGMTKRSKDGIYNKSQFPFNFVSKYNTDSIPKCFIKEQLLELYEMGIVKIGLSNDLVSSINILSDEAYDYVFPNGQANVIKSYFSTKEDMHDYIKIIVDSLKSDSF